MTDCTSPRQTWDETWMAVAQVIAGRVRCLNAQVGAVIVDVHNRPISTGYNGPARNFKVPVESHCDQWCPRRQNASQSLSYGLSCLSIHAEANALMFADRRDYEGGTIYVTRACCQDCSKLISNSGLARVVQIVTESDQHRQPEVSIEYLRKCGLIVDLL